ncbi:MAG: flagellar filament capping protein FliD [Clostridia bacterium]|nr:flagellar filament capping protein FliD [Clostridia bacterium]
MRAGGLVSGLDTQQLIAKLIQVERQPMDVMKSRKRTYELRKDLWKEINSSLLSLKTKVSTISTSTDLIKKKATSSDDTVFTASSGTSASNSTYNINITTLAKAQRVNGTTQSTAALNLSGSFTINDGTYTSTINVVATDTLSTIMSKINNAKDNVDSSKGLQVTASIVNNILVLEHKKTGTANSMTLTDDVNTPGSTGTNEILESLGILNDSKAIANQQQAATNAQFTVNGISVTRSSNAGLTDVINGVTLTLKKEGAAGTLTVQNDVDASVAAIKDWVNQYNTTIDLIGTRLSEESVKGATSDAIMSKGLLRGDSVLVGIKNQLRQNSSNPVVGLAIYDRLADIGITTTADDFGKSGRLAIDETKLKAALEAKPEEVAKLFTNNMDLNGDTKVTTDEKGIAIRLTEQLDYLTSTATKAISGKTVAAGVIQGKINSLDKVINDYIKKMEAFEERLEKVESNLWNQFTAMEKAMSNMQSQATWLAGQLSGLNSAK